MKRCPWCGDPIRNTAPACTTHADIEAELSLLERRMTADDAARELESLERELREEGDRA